MTKEDIWRIAIEQSAIDLNCTAEDFYKNGSTVVISKLNEGRKKYYKKPMFCDFAYYGHGLVASVDERIRDFIEEFTQKHSGFRCFDNPQQYALNREFSKYGKCICFMAEYFLPDPGKKVTLNENIEIKLFKDEEVQTLYRDDRFHMALSYDNTSDKRDVLAAAGYINGEIAGVAGVSNDSETMWQIGIDVLTEYRNLGVATTLTKFVTDEVIKLGKVPFYCTAWSNIASKSNAVKCGYKTAWVEMTAIDIGEAMKMIGEPN